MDKRQLIVDALEGKGNGLNITRDEFLTAESYIWTCANRNSKNGITGYNLYLSFKNKPMKKVEGGDYWSDTKRYYWIIAWGLSRPLELWLKICYRLGLEFEDLNQNKIKEL